MCPIYTDFIDALKSKPKTLTEEEKKSHREKKICLVCKRKVAGFDSFICPKCDKPLNFINRKIWCEYCDFRTNY